MAAARGEVRVTLWPLEAFMTPRSLALFAACLCGVPAILTAQSLSRVQILALQQQLRDDGCGVTHTTGRIDAATRQAINKCQSRYNAPDNSPASVLAAMNIGFGPRDFMPTISTSRRGAGRAARARGMMRDTTVRDTTVRDTTVRDTTMRDTTKRDSTMRDTMMRDSTMRDSTP
jgi:hypothetical protein